MDARERLTLIMDELRGRKASQCLEIRDMDFPEQDRFVMDASRFIDACTTRRAGKSNGLGLRFYRTLQRHPGARCPYIALTRDSAKNIMWDVLQEQDEKYKIGARFTPSNLTVTIPRFDNAEIKLFGADMKNFIKRLRGQKWPGVGIDEAQDFGQHLEDLVDNVVTPAISDYADGWLAMTGTPGPVPHGLFYEITENRKYGYSHHAWSLYQNPYLPNPKQFVADLKKKKGWADNHPTLMREYQGLWVLDLEALVFKYRAEKNHYEQLPKLKRGWNHVFGVDLGYDDADAIAVLAWNDASPNVYLVHESINRGQTVTALTAELIRLIKLYEPMKIVMDTGGLGKKIAKEIQRRTSIGIEPADKARKFEHIEFLNDGLRTGRFFAKETSQFASDASKVKWDYEKSHGDRLVISDSFHSDICDAVQYSYTEALHWLHEPEKERPAKGTPEAAALEADEMEEQLEAAMAGGGSDDGWGKEWEKFG